MNTQFTHQSCGLDKLVGVEKRFDVYSCNGGFSSGKLLLRFGNERQEVFNLSEAMLLEEGFFDRNPTLSWARKYITPAFSRQVKKQVGLDAGAYNYIIAGTQTGRWATTAATTTDNILPLTQFYYALDATDRAVRLEPVRQEVPQPVTQEWAVWNDTEQIDDLFR